MTARNPDGTGSDFRELVRPVATRDEYTALFARIDSNLRALATPPTLMDMSARLCNAQEQLRGQRPSDVSVLLTDLLAEVRALRAELLPAVEDLRRGLFR